MEAYPVSKIWPARVGHFAVRHDWLFRGRAQGNRVVERQTGAGVAAPHGAPADPLGDVVGGSEHSDAVLLLDPVDAWKGDGNKLFDRKGMVRLCRDRGRDGGLDSSRSPAHVSVSRVVAGSIAETLNDSSALSPDSRDPLGRSIRAAFLYRGQLGRRHIITQIVATLAAMATSWPMVMVERNIATWCIMSASNGAEPVCV